MKQWMSIHIKGNHSQWSFSVKEDPKYLDEWTADGIEVFIIENTIPQWAVSLGLIRPWFALQNFWNKALRLW